MATPNSADNPALKALVQQWTSKVGTEFERVQKRMDPSQLEGKLEMNEFHFRAFIDFFAGKEDLMYFGKGLEARQRALAVWLNHSGGGLREVDVVKIVDGQRQIVFTVPAVYDRTMVEPTLRDPGKPSVFGAVVNTNTIAGHSGSAAELYLKRYLDERLDAMWHPEVMRKNAQAWNKIFSFYGLPAMVAALSDEKPKASDPSKDEVVGFDPL